MSDDSEIANLSTEQVIQYLKENPNFFKTHPTLIADLNFSHETGDAVSLIQRQVELLREHHDTMRKRLGELASHSKNNEALLERIKALSVSTAGAGTPKTILEGITRTIIEDFGLDSVYLAVEHSIWPMTASNVIGLTPEEVGTVRNCVYNLSVFVGRPPEKMRDLLFKEGQDDVESIAMARFKYKDVDTYLIIGSKDKEHFTNDMGTDFITYIGEFLQAVLAR